mmetsp:Transcript_14717/g.41667  ORF Transcript_14717/g.41667 Transcript_14717/m.41667 type:complete len:136 (+) Transcript_14717:859-1266(+)
MFRDAPVESKSLSQMGWLSRNVLENRAFSAVLLVLLLTLPFSTGVVSNIGDIQDMIAGYGELFSTSKLVSVSSLDLTILTLVGASLIPADYQLRSGGNDSPDSEMQGKLIAVSTLLFPVVGLATYCALRPRLSAE